MRARLACPQCGLLNRTRKLRCGRCGESLRNRIGGRFEQLRCIAANAPWLALHARDHDAGQDVFLRVLMAGSSAGDKRAFSMEVRLLQATKGKAGFPMFVHAGEIHGTGIYYLAQESVQGRPLDAALRKTKPARIVEVYLDVLRPVAALHSAGFVYGSLSPGRFLATASGRVVLTGLWRLRESGSRAAGTGAQGFMAPEQWQGTELLTAATDVFALSAILYSILTGRPPYRGRNGSGVLRPGSMPKAPSLLNHKLSPDFDDILLKALARRPSERYADAEAFFHALDHWQGTTTTVDDLGLPFVPPVLQWLAALGEDGWGLVQGGCALAVRMGRLVARWIRGYALAMSRVTSLKPAVVCALTAAAVLMPVLVIPRVLQAKALHRAATPPAVPRRDIEALPAAVAPAMQQAHASVGFFTWPPAWIHFTGLDDIYRKTEAPSPEVHRMKAGVNTVEIVGRDGARRVFYIDLAVGKVYRFKFNAESDFFELEEVE